MTSRERSTARPSGHVWMAAQQFYEAAELLVTSNPTRYAQPIVMNYAFSSELALKSSEVVTRFGSEGRLEMDGVVQPGKIIGAATLKSSVQGHDLPAVFRRLQPDTQKGIQFEFAKETGKDLLPLLERCANDFGKARYVYEEASAAFDIGAHEELARGLLNAVMRHGGGTARIERAD